MKKMFGPFNTTILEFEKLCKKTIFKDVEDLDRIMKQSTTNNSDRLYFFFKYK